MTAPSFILSIEEVEMFYAIFTIAARVDWSLYDQFRERILATRQEKKEETVSQ